MSMSVVDAAAIEPFENDLADMNLEDIESAIREAQDQLEEIEPWLEALYAKQRQMAADSAEALEQ